MQECIKLELKKAFRKKFLWGSIAIGLAFTLLALYKNVSAYLSWASAEFVNKNPMLEGCTAFDYWIGGEPFSVGTSLYFFLFLLLIALPYGSSYCEEKSNGYRRMVIGRVGRKSVSG